MIWLYNVIFSASTLVDNVINMACGADQMQNNSMFLRQGTCLYNRITGLLSELSTLPSIPVFASIIQNPPMFCLDAERGSQSSLLHHILGRVNVLADSSAIALFPHGFPTFTKRP